MFGADSKRAKDNDDSENDKPLKRGVNSLLFSSCFLRLLAIVATTGLRCTSLSFAFPLQARKKPLAVSDQDEQPLVSCHA